MLIVYPLLALEIVQGLHAALPTEQPDRLVCGRRHMNV